MTQHLVTDIVEQYVIGALDAESVRFVEGHVAHCAPCAKLLQQEAALEVTLHQAGRHLKVVSLSSRRRRCYRWASRPGHARRPTSSTRTYARPMP